MSGSRRSDAGAATAQLCTEVSDVAKPWDCERSLAARLDQPGVRQRRVALRWDRSRLVVTDDLLRRRPAGENL
jgi:hypothetical protein